MVLPVRIAMKSRIMPILRWTDIESHLRYHDAKPKFRVPPVTTPAVPAASVVPVSPIASSCPKGKAVAEPSKKRKLLKGESNGST